MPYSDATTGPFPQAISCSAAGSRPAPGGAVSDIIPAVTEAQITPGGTAFLPFTACTAYGIPSIHEFSVSSDNPEFNREWARIRQAPGDSYNPRYVLEISLGDIGRAQYGAYPLRLSWASAGTRRYAEGQCTLVIRPCVRALTEPAVETWPAGRVFLALENSGDAVIDVAVSIRHCGSDWSRKWNIELAPKGNPFGFSGTFDSPAGKLGGDFEVAVSAAGVLLVRRAVRARRSLISRKRIAAGMVPRP